MTTRILLVDDSPTVRYRYEVLLRREDYSVDSAVDGQEALDMLGPNHDYQLVISDLKMPRLDGRELVKRIRKSPMLKLLPVLMLTSSEDKQEEIKSLKSDVSDYVQHCQRRQDESDDEFRTRRELHRLEFLARVQKLIRMKRLQDENEVLSRADPLTSLANRRHGVERLTEEMGRARRYGRELTVALVDIDHFKRVNDRYGHQAGDEVLVSVADDLRSVSRGSDFVIRWGGEEFLFVFPETTLDEAAGIVERFRQHVDDNPVPASVQGGVSIAVTISGGVAELEEDDTLERLVDRADRALYSAKETGRNRLLMWQRGELQLVGA